MLYIIIAILMFGLLIGIHELGYFIAAKLSGVRVLNFPSAWAVAVAREGKETKYSHACCRWVACAMEGEDEGE